MQQIKRLALSVELSDTIVMFGKSSKSDVREVSISNSTLFRIIGLSVAFILLLGAIYIARKPLMLIVIAGFLALALSPPVNLVASKLPGKSRGIATAISYVTILSIIGVVFYTLLPPVVNQTQNFVQQLPEYISEVEDGQDGVSQLINEYELDNQVEQLKTEISQRYASIGGSLIDLVGGFFNNVAAILTIIVVAFFMLVEGPMWIQKFWELQPAFKLKRRKEVAAKMYRVITGFVNGQLVIAALAGLSVFVMLTIVSVPYALPLSVLTALLGLIPFIGATISAVVIVTSSFFESATAAVVMLIFFIVYQQIENNFIQPVVQSRTTEASPLLVLVATIIGVFVGGILGAILAIPLAGCLRVLVKHYVESHHLMHEAK